MSSSASKPAGYDFWASKRRLAALRGTLAFTVILLLSFVMMLPLVWMVCVSLKEPQNVFQNPPFRVDWQWQNFRDAWYLQGLPSHSGDFWTDVQNFFGEKESFWIYLWNTVIITICSTTGAVLSGALVAYGFARLRFPGRNALFLLLISTMLVPAQVTMIPTYILYSALGWVGTFLPLIVPSWLGGAFNIFLLRQFFMSVPVELDEAAKIDGCSTLGIFWRILLPLSMPALVTISIFAIVYNWNDFLNPMIYLKDTRDFTLAIGLTQFSSLYGNKTHLLMAASTVVLMPILVLFFIGQKYFIQGIATTGLKG
ncbi:MAG: carbohydrate ABC transporter permease [candidate division FCPU426 bacterium]